MDEIKMIIKALNIIDDQINADGCTGCAYVTTEEWEMPCCKCKRGCNDYWRSGKLKENK